tara:strand:+ start:417 stop:842 length:426 start_codon:yes stop_codon:yes gene_type:complete
MVGMFLKDRELQYTANRDEITNTWRILDTWHEDLMNLGPDDEIEDTSKAVTILTEGAFIALVKEAARLGVLQNAAFEGHTALEDENIALREKILDLEKHVSTTTEEIQHINKSESFLLKEMAMQTMLKLTSMSDIENLTKD